MLDLVLLRHPIRLQSLLKELIIALAHRQDLLLQLVDLDLLGLTFKQLLLIRQLLQPVLLSDLPELFAQCLYLSRLSLSRSLSLRSPRPVPLVPRGGWYLLWVAVLAFKALIEGKLPQLLLLAPLLAPPLQLGLVGGLPFRSFRRIASAGHVEGLSQPIPLRLRESTEVVQALLHRFLRRLLLLSKPQGRHGFGAIDAGEQGARLGEETQAITTGGAAFVQPVIATPAHLQVPFLYVLLAQLARS